MCNTTFLQSSSPLRQPIRFSSLPQKLISPKPQEPKPEEDDFDRLIDAMLSEPQQEEATSTFTWQDFEPIPLPLNHEVSSSIPSNGNDMLHKTSSAITTASNMPLIPSSATTTTTTQEIPLVNMTEKPKRPMTAYNFFFQAQRQMLLQHLPGRAGGRKPRNSHGKLGFAEMARFISAQWKQTTMEQRAPLQQLAAQDKQRYQREMAHWKQQQREREQEREREQKQTQNHQSHSTCQNNVMDTHFPVSMPTAMTCTNTTPLENAATLLLQQRIDSSAMSSQAMLATFASSSWGGQQV